MPSDTEQLVMRAARRAASRVPAYKTLLNQAKVDAESIKTLDDFQRLPVLEKRDTFQRFDIADLCVEGQLGELASVLTSSGHSGVFAFGLNAEDETQSAAESIDDLLDHACSVRSKKSLLINCLPMGVKVPTQACTLAETSVRPDMAIGLIKAFGCHFAQIILVGETAFLKHVLEMGVRSGVNWREYLVHVIVGEEPLAENARKYIEGIVGMDPRHPEDGIMFSSMGIGEVGLNLFCEVPPSPHLILLRRALHENEDLRKDLIGAARWVPSVFTYDTRRIFVEFDHAKRLILTTLSPRSNLPLIRYSPGDRGEVLHLPARLKPIMEDLGVSWNAIESLPLVLIWGRGKSAFAGETPVYPEAVKEGIYLQAELARRTTANFRLVSGAERARLRIQLVPGLAPRPEFAEEFSHAVSQYVSAPLEVSCESYETFRSGMALDYERKFDYLGP